MPKPNQELKVHELVDKSFSNRRGRDGSKRIYFRQMRREELVCLLSQLRDSERQRAAGIAESHEDDDPRSPSILALSIRDEILGIA